MHLTRRTLLMAAPALALAPHVARAADDPRLAPRFVGRENSATATAISRSIRWR